MHKWISLNGPGDIDQLAGELLKEFEGRLVVAKLRGRLSPEIKGVLVEYPYVDKDYRSTYYGFYAKRGFDTAVSARASISSARA